MEAASSDAHRPESSHQDMGDGPPLDVERAKLSLQHVRALNTQFASWVQSQLQNHLDELWIDGVKDYLTHASNILGEYKDVVDWLRENAAKSQSKLSNSFPSDQGNADSNPANISSPNVVMPSLSLPKSAGNQIPVSASGQGNIIFMSQNIKSSTSLAADVGSSEVIIPTNVSLTQASNLCSNSQSLLNSKMNTEFSKDETSTSLPLFQCSNLASSSLAGGFFSSSSASSTSLGIQNFTQPKVVMSGDADEGGELDQPSSPSLKKIEEKGILIVHEVKCKVYIKDSPSDNSWKDMGAGNLTIKCKEGAEKATKESKPTIICRNDVGKIVLNALIYPGIKMNIQKTSIVSIFHTAGGEDGRSGEAVARPYLLRLKSLEDTAKLAETIREYTPSA